MTWRSRSILWAMTLAPLAFLSERFRDAIEGSMPLHMMVQFPILLLAGAGAAWLTVQRQQAFASAWSRFDAEGVFGLVTLSAVAVLWMVPAALDAALMHPEVAAWKYCSWWVAGGAIALAWPRMAGPMRMFLIVNLAWMLLTAGSLYADAEQRLCASYRYDEQLWTGRALQAAAGLLVAAWIGGAAAGSRVGCSAAMRSIESCAYRHRYRQTDALRDGAGSKEPSQNIPDMGSLMMCSNHQRDT